MPSSPPSGAPASAPGRLMFVARTLRGLEAIAAEEIAARLDLPASALALGHREVRFRAARLAPALVELGTVDDVLLVLAAGPPLDGAEPPPECGPGRGRGGPAARAADPPRATRSGRAIAVLRALADDLDESALAALLALRGLPARPHAIDVSATAVGVRTAGRFALEDAVGAALARRGGGGWRYHSRAGGARPPATTLSFRIHATARDSWLAVRVAPRPLHRRAYRPPSATRAGALHPPLARALARLARTAPGERLLDPMCGTGTIPIEAALADPRVAAIGCDIRPEPLALARRACERAGLSSAETLDARFATADAAALPLDAGSVGAVAVNPPWGRAVAPLGRLASGYDALADELRRILAPSGRVVVLEPAGGPLVTCLHARGFVSRRATWVRVGGALADVVIAHRPQ